MKQELMRNTAIASVIFCVIALGVIYYAVTHPGADRDTVLDETSVNIVGAYDTGNQEINTADTNINEDHLLIFELGYTDTNYLCIPLPQGIRAGDVSIENHYMEGEMWIAIKGGDDDFYATHALSGNRKNVSTGFYEQQQDVTWLKLLLTDICEYRSILEDHKLYVEFVPPRELYDKIVVIDPAFGGSDEGSHANGITEKEVVLTVARKVKEQLDATDIKAYYTRLDDSEPEDADRVRLANEAKADMLIRIQANADEDSRIYGTIAVYNESFFIPGFGSIELADLLEREVVTNIKGKAVGLEAAVVEDYVIRQATVPAAAIKIGYVTNAQEAILLQREDYLEKIAAGIVNSILAAYTQIE